MTKQRGEKRAAKVLKRKQRLTKLAHKSNIKKAIYAFEKALKAEEHDHHDHEGHDCSEHK